MPKQNQINAIILSKDRAMQLRLLLDSIYKYADGVFNINILYKSTNDIHKNAYEKLIQDYIKKPITWREDDDEDDFKNKLLTLMKGTLPLTCMFTDDDVLYGPIELGTIYKTMDMDDALCFSLRLGENCTYCYNMNCDNRLVVEEINKNFIRWNWQKHYLDFGYPLSIDGHVFRTKEISKLTSKITFEDPNTYEVALQMFDTHPKEMMASYRVSKVVNLPVNMVQTAYPDNRHAETISYDASELSEKYLSGEIIDLKSMDFSDIKGCHQEVDLKFKQS